jgi:hypothetical protein
MNKIYLINYSLKQNVLLLFLPKLRSHCRVKAWNYNTPKASHFNTTKASHFLHDKIPHFYTAGVSHFYTEKVSFLAVLQPCFLHNKKPEFWKVNFTAIERKITQQKCDVLVLFFKYFYITKAHF